MDVDTRNFQKNVHLHLINGNYFKQLFMMISDTVDLNVKSLFYLTINFKNLN